MSDDPDEPKSPDTLFGLPVIYDDTLPPTPSFTVEPMTREHAAAIIAEISRIRAENIARDREEDLVDGINKLDGEPS